MRSLPACILFAFVVSCSSSPVQTSEFGYYGSAEIRGTVVGSQQQPLSGMIVGPVYLPGRGTFNTSISETDQSGRFQFTVYRFSLPQTSPDTVSVYVRAADPRTAGTGMPATLRDSVLVTVTMAPFGRGAALTTVAITLRTP